MPMRINFLRHVWGQNSGRRTLVRLQGRGKWRRRWPRVSALADRRRRAELTLTEIAQTASRMEELVARSRLSWDRRGGGG